MNTGGDAQGDTLLNIEAVLGSDFDDTLTGGSGVDTLFGGKGNDILDGGSNLDVLIGQEGDDTYLYSSGSKIINETSGNDKLIFDSAWAPSDLFVSGNIIGFTSSSDTISFNDINQIELFSFSGMADMTLTQLIAATSAGSQTGTNADDTFTGTSAVENFDGLAGSDTVDYSASPAAIKVDLLNGSASGGDANGDQMTSIENIIGSDLATGRDQIWGDNNDNALYGMAGKDILEGGGGADIIDGGAGWDYARYTRSASGVTVNLETNVNTGGDAQGDTLLNIEAVMGSNYNDSIHGGSGNDYLLGQNGDDILYGGDGLDYIVGGSGSDTFTFDRISGTDPVDSILDFTLSDGDKLDISDILSGYDPLTDAITDFVQITDNGTDSTIAVDVDGGADQFIALAHILGVTGLGDEEGLETAGTLITV